MRHRGDLLLRVAPEGRRVDVEPGSEPGVRSERGRGVAGAGRRSHEHRGEDGGKEDTNCHPAGVCRLTERFGQRPRVDDDERLRRPRQRDVELAQARSPSSAIAAGSTTTTWSNSRPFAWRGVRIGNARRTSSGRRDERARRDHRDQPVEVLERDRLAQRRLEQLVLGHLRRAAAASPPCGTRAAARPRARSRRAAAARSP